MMKLRMVIPMALVVIIIKALNSIDGMEWFQMKALVTLIVSQGLFTFYFEAFLYWCYQDRVKKQ